MINTENTFEGGKKDHHRKENKSFKAPGKMRPIWLPYYHKNK